MTQAFKSQQDILKYLVEGGSVVKYFPNDYKHVFKFIDGFLYFTDDDWKNKHGDCTPSHFDYQPYQEPVKTLTFDDLKAGLPGVEKIVVTHPTDGEVLLNKYPKADWSKHDECFVFMAISLGWAVEVAE